MIHKTWYDNPTTKQITCVHVDAKKFTVENVLTPGKVYDVKNESDEFYFVVDDTGKMGGFYKEYFEEK
ncbi:hypothetical protein CEY16_03290 [Halalkalibacillus sediminis]|uniref:Uncharacterized protein n=1 Tax=Halalkalibacillus sediminis TaxID=2018042 RepID=A0A2I0QWT1_9BACI|nr:DUF6501 family protein [Halalkalibacillus sediminis]PKR78792.1 hypothetical protein CEY16_03290 [Halalkalibacillus sediminis]